MNYLKKKSYLYENSNPLWKDQIKVGVAFDALNYVKMHAGYQIIEFISDKAENLLDAIKFDTHASRLYIMQKVVEKYPHIAEQARIKYESIKSLKETDPKVVELI